MYLGSWKIDDYLTFSCNTHRADTGAATNADAVPTYRIYEDETATPIITGSMALLDGANTVGFYSERTQLTAASGLEKGKTYTIYITATVNGVVGTMSHTFQIEAEVDANVVSDKTGYALSVTPPTAAQIQAEMEENGASVLDTLQDRLTDARAGYLDNLSAGAVALAATALSNVTWTDARAAVLSDWINGERLDLILDAIAGDVVNIDGAAMRGTDGANTVVPDVAGTAATPSEVATALTDIHLDHLFAVDYDPASKPGVATALLNELIENDGGVSRYTANALEQAPGGSGANPNLLLDAEIATVTDQTNFTLATGSDVDDAYNDQAVVLYDDSNSDYPSIRVITNYVGATKTVTIDSAPDFTLGADDSIKIFVTAPGASAPTAAQVADAVWDEAIADHQSAGTFGLKNQNQVPSESIDDYKATGFAVPNEYDTEMARLDVNVSSRNATTPPTVTEIRQEIDANSTRLDVNVSTRSSHSASDVWQVATRTLTSFGTLVADIWNRLTSALTTTGSIGKLLVDNVDVTVSSRSSHSASDNWSVATRTLTAGTKDTEIDAMKITSDKLDDTLEDDAGTYRFTENALEQAPSGTGGDATAANQTTILAKLLAYIQLLMRSDAAIKTDNATELTEINADGGSGVGDYDNETDSNEATVDRGNVAWLTGGGLSGSNAITINIKDGDSNNVVECAVEIWDEDNTTYYERKVTDSGGDTTHNIDDGTYTVRIHKAGYVFSDQTLVVSAAATVNYTGTTILIGTPASADACRVYEFCKQQNGIDPMTSVTATAQIIILPYDYSGSLHAGDIVDGTYNIDTGFLYWDIVRGAKVKFKISVLGNFIVDTIPDLDNARLSDI